MRLSGKVALVTGASRGIGYAVAKRFAAEGAKVAVNYNNTRSGAEKLLKEIRKAGGVGMIVKADVSDSRQVEQMVKKVLREYGRIDILVNNAGVMYEKTFLDATEEIWDKTMDINLKGGYLCSKAVAPFMLKQKKGKIIFMSSNSGLYHPTALRFVEYSTSKAGMNGLTKALALKLGPYINVNAICPGWIKTDMVAAADTELENRIIEETPLKRYGTADEVANAALYLASSESDFVTGELHIVAGGRGMH
jgi:3-oxoacyl-[acyl-carrier protein] reductase